jgi:DNA replicative helicase MCM subunit Mcm2 (Cdc46/Mcm family)
MAFVAAAREYFENFLLSFTLDADAAPTSNVESPYVEQARRRRPKLNLNRPLTRLAASRRLQCKMLRETERTTLFVDFQHLASYDSELADAVVEHFHSLEPHLCASVGKVMAQLHQAHAHEKNFHVSFFNLPHLCCIRELRTDKIATLVSFTGTVTRTTDVRPELLHGVFTCKLCNAVSDPYAAHAHAPSHDGRVARARVAAILP